jgi:stage V sporulation protein AF
MDNSPAVMIFPNSIADFSKETDDYYFPPLTGTYVRIIRAVVSVLTVVMTPIVLIWMNNPHLLPRWLEFINTDEEYLIPIFFQFLLLELFIDGLRLASLNTPNTLSSSLGIIGGLILGEFAVESGWFVSETIMYMAFVAIASFAQPSFEMGYAMKFSRIFLLVLSQFFGFWGFFGGMAAVLLLAGFSKTLSGRSYLSPIIPFKPQEFARMFIRTGIRYKNH